MGDAAAQSRFDVTETAGTNDDHVYIVLLSAGDNCACDRAFLHFGHDIVDALLARAEAYNGGRLRRRAIPLLQRVIELDPATKEVLWTFDQYDVFGNSVPNSQLLDVGSSKR